MSAEPFRVRVRYAQLPRDEKRADDARDQRRVACPSCAACGSRRDEWLRTVIRLL